VSIQYVPDHNVFLYPPCNGNDRKSLLGADRRVCEMDNGQILVPNDHRTLQTLVAAGVPVGMPMMDYDWPIAPGREPWRVQKLQANFQVLYPYALNLSDMRTGKTLSSLWAADYIMRKESNVKVLIACQLSTTRRTWGDAIFENFLGRRTFAILTGSPQRRLRQLERDVDFYIINYEGLGIGKRGRKTQLQFTGLSRAIDQRSDIQIVIIDEASAYRNPATDRHDIARHMLVGRRYLWLLTGTPTPQAPTDAYGLAKLVNNADGQSFTAFKNRTMVQISQFKWVPRPEAKKLVYNLLQPAIRITQEQCFDATKLVHMSRQAELSAEQTKRYRELKHQLTIQLKDHKGDAVHIDAVNQAALRSKLIQIACGAVYDEEHFAHLLDARPRLAVLEEVIYECPHKWIVFAPLTSVLKLISSHLTALKLSHTTIDGNVVGEERDKRLKAFMGEGGPRGLVAHPGPIARGLDFTQASTVIWYAPTDIPEDYTQANERINGPAQKHLRTVVHIGATLPEWEIYRRLKDKQSLQGAILKLLEKEEE